MHLEYFKKEILPLKNKLFRFAKSYLGDAESAEDIVQDVFIKIWNKRTDLDKVKNKEAWCMIITKNLVMDHFRKNKYRQINQNKTVEMTIDNQSPDVVYEQSEVTELINDLIDTLPVRQKEVIILREFEQYSYQQIGEIMGLDLNLVKVTLYRARDNLRKKLLNTKRYGS